MTDLDIILAVVSGITIALGLFVLFAKGKHHD